MKIGMLWFNNDPKMPFAEKCQGLIDYYIIKYGQLPTAIVVHPKTFSEQGAIAIAATYKITITTSRSVLPNHFWVGLDTDEEKQNVKSN